MMRDRPHLYYRVPTPIQHMAVSVEGLRISRRRYGPRFERILAAANMRQDWSVNQLAAFRDERLQRFVRHAITTVPHYRDVCKASGIGPDDIRTISDLEILPVLDKAKVQDDPRRFESEAIDRRSRVIAHTSGSTGAGLRFASTADALAEQWAIWWRYRKHHGIDRKTWCGYFGGRSIVSMEATRAPYWRYNLPARQTLFSGYHVSPTTIGSYVRELRRWRIPWLHGYPSLLALIAEYSQAVGGLGYDLKWVTTGAENLLPQQAHIIRAGFGVDPIEHYGLAEAVANASMCARGHLHLDEDFAAVELVPLQGTTAYRIIGTNFSNPATPLLRYDTGDLVTGGFSECDCGLPGRALPTIDGRREDYVLLKNGARIGRLDHVFKDLVQIREAQIYQPCAGAVVVRVVKGRHYDITDEAMLRRELAARLTGDMTITVEYLPKLERTNTGKLRLVVSDLKAGNLSTGSGEV